jgi:diguanylate cyclase (GGDEF)-like protein
VNLSIIITSLGALLTIFLIFINYFNKYTADNFQRQVLLTLLAAAAITILTDFISRYFSGNFEGSIVVRYSCYAIVSLYLIAQNCTYYLSVVFIDYFAYRSPERSKRMIILIVIFLLLYTISVIANLPTGFYFTISYFNEYIPGNFYPLRLLLSYGPILFILIDVLLASKNFKHSQVYLIILFVFLAGAGATIDILLPESNLTWPFFAVAVLYFYFFIIQSDSKIDSITGIGNRFSFNEFIDKLSRQNTRVEYSIVMMDIDKFKEINDTLGHIEGDNALRDLASIIKGCIRHSDFAARYGGDEFVLATEAEYDIKRLMHRIQSAIDQQNEKRIRPYQIYISYGYDVYTTKSDESIYTFLARIDARMYRQKERRKRNGIPSSITDKLNINNNEEIYV